MSPIATRVPDNPQVPEEVDVVVIGGGIVGAAAAYFLAKKGHSVALVEKGRIAGEQSSRNWGWCRQTGKSLSELPLTRRSLEIWRRLNEEIAADTGFRQIGSLIVSDDPKEIAEWETWREQARDFQVQSQLLTPDEVAKMLPDAHQRWRAGLYSPSDGKAEPTFAASEIAKAAQRLGVSIHQTCAARGMETSGGRISAVVTEKGSIRTNAVICAAGAWTSMFCRWHGIRLPQAGVFATAFRTEASNSPIPIALGSDRFSVRPSEGGGFTIGLRGRGRLEITPQGLSFTREFLPLFRKRIKNLTLGAGRSFFRGPEAWTHWKLDGLTPFEVERVFDPAPDPALVDKAMGQLRESFPKLAGLKVAEAWGGFIESSPDALPVISTVDRLPGFVVATGFSGKGFGAGPAAGELAAALVTGEKPAVEPNDYRYARLIDGTMRAGSGWI